MKIEIAPEQHEQTAAIYAAYIEEKGESRKHLKRLWHTTTPKTAQIWAQLLELKLVTSTEDGRIKRTEKQRWAGRYCLIQSDTALKYTPKQLAKLATLAAHCDYVTGVLCASQRKAAAWWHLSDRQTRRIFAKLTAAGEITRVAGGYKLNYLITTDNPERATTPAPAPRTDTPTTAAAKPQTIPTPAQQTAAAQTIPTPAQQTAAQAIPTPAPRTDTPTTAAGRVGCIFAHIRAHANQVGEIDFKGIKVFAPHWAHWVRHNEEQVNDPLLDYATAGDIVDIWCNFNEHCVGCRETLEKDITKYVERLKAAGISRHAVYMFAAENSCNYEWFNRDDAKRRAWTEKVIQWVIGNPETTGKTEGKRGEAYRILNELSDKEKKRRREEEERRAAQAIPTPAPATAAGVGGTLAAELEEMFSGSKYAIEEEIKRGTENGGVERRAMVRTDTSTENGHGRRRVSKEELRAVMCETEEEYWQMLKEWEESMKREKVERRAMVAKVVNVEVRRGKIC